MKGKFLRPLAAVSALAMLVGCADPLARQGDRDPNPNAIVVGSAGFLESQIVGQVYIDVLEANGFDVTNRLNSGTRERYIPALRAGDLDLVPDYLGNLVQYFAASDPNLSEADLTRIQALTAEPDLVAALPEILPDGVNTLEPAEGASNDSVTVTPETAAEHNLKTIADLAELSKTQTVSLMANSEFATRSVGIPGLERVYGMKVDFKPNNDGGGQGTLNELLAGRVTAADIYTTTPSITEHNLVVLEDPGNVFPANNIVPVVADEKMTPELQAVMNVLASKLTTAELRNLNNMVSGPEKLEIEEAVDRWINQQGLNQPIEVPQP